MRYILTFVLIGLTLTNGFGQLVTYPYKKYSVDSSYFLISIPYKESKVYTIPDDIRGHTKVFNADSSLIWNINRYFDPDFVFINSAGNTLTCVTHTSFLKDFSDSSPPIIFFKKGGFVRKYNTKELILKPKKGYSNQSWIYTNSFKGGIKEKHKIHQRTFVEYNSYEPDSVEMLMGTNSIYTRGDTLFITTSEDRIAVFDLNTGEIINWIDNAYEFTKKNNISPDILTIVKIE